MGEAVKTTEFGMHPAVTFAFIRDQGGSLENALREVAMNAGDSGSGRVDMTITQDRITVVDDGAGFRSTQEVDDFFSTVGTPHVEGDAKWGRNRTGRLKLFAFGRNEWRSGRFRMIVDVRSRGLEHDVHDQEEDAPGCAIAIDLYDPLGTEDVLRLAHAMRQSVEWVDMTVTINGHVATRDKSAEKWTLETDDAWIRADGSNFLRICNMGIHVANSYGHRTGVTGVVVSKRALELNAARNEVSASCEVWARIREQLATIVSKRRSSGGPRKTARKVWLSSAADQTNYARGILDGSVTILAALEGRADVIRTAMHLGQSLRALASPLGGAIGSSPSDSPEARMVMSAKIATVVLGKTLSDFGARDVGELVGILTARAAAEVAAAPNRRLANFVEDLSKARLMAKAEMDEMFAGNCAEVDAAGLDHRQAAGLAALNAMSRRHAGEAGVPFREVRAGESVTRQMWTDGKVIWAAQDSLAGMSAAYGAMRAAALVIESYCATEPNAAASAPSPDEAMAFNDLMTGGQAAGWLAAQAAADAARAAAEAFEPDVGKLSELADFEDLCRKARRS